MESKPVVHTCFEPTTGTWQYIVADPVTKQGAIIDSVLDYNPTTDTLSTTSADQLLKIVSDNGLKITRVMETHAHADHLTASRYLQQKLVQAGHSRPDICIGKRITQVQATFGSKYGVDPGEIADVFDKLFDDNEQFQIGQLSGKVLHLPGHTPDHVGYVIGENVFTGDSIFNPDVGSARCDFPGGSASELWKSTQTLLSLPPEYRLYTGHDYPPDSRTPGETGDKQVPYTTVAQQKATNKHVKSGTLEEEFVRWRSERDATLSEPKLLHRAMPFNIRAGRLPSTGADSWSPKGAGNVLAIL